MELAFIGCPLWSMLYITAISLSVSVVEILITVRSSLFGACSWPCQVPAKLWAKTMLPERAAQAIVHRTSVFIAACR
jgi:hypothetical protein